MSELLQVLDAGGTLALSVLTLAILWRGMPALSAEIRSLRDIMTRIDERTQVTEKRVYRMQRDTNPQHLTPPEGVPVLVERETTVQRSRHAKAGGDDD